MYNLLVSANEEAWNGGSYDYESGRCFEYTSPELVDRFGSLSDAAITLLRKHPCLFAYEALVKQDPKIGRIVRVEKRQGKVRIYYELEEITPFLSHGDVEELRMELDIDKWELNRTHWAIKDVSLPQAVLGKGIILPAWASGPKRTVDITAHTFNVALSFPGEVRPYVESVAKLLEKSLGPNAYFYDNNYKAQLARPNLDTLLQGIYRDRSKLVVVFLCAAYGSKEWCGVEFRAIKDIIKAKLDRVMFIRTDKGSVDGVFSTDGYIDATTHTPDQIAEFITERADLCK